MPRHQDPDNMPAIEQKRDPLFPIYLPLQIFDDEEYDCRTPEEWLLLGLEPGSQDRKPVPGKALLPTDDQLGHEDPKNHELIYKWVSVGVLDYDKETKLYLVHKTNKRGMVRDEEGRPILNGGVTPEGRAPLMPCQYWVPRVRLLFLAEDPHVFAQRVVSANTLCKETQALLRYNLYVDCMPVDGLRSIDEKSLGRMKQLAMSTSHLRKEIRVLNCLQCLEKEVSLDYERTMNKIIFDGVITSKPQTFSYVTLPEKEEEKVPERGMGSGEESCAPVGLQGSFCELISSLLWETFRHTGL
uniref:Dynein axonemal heavy chain 1 n=1 Tax=Terrapene triunguis TaxID=2587831 RepID=A0A674I6L3_9SAUR